MRPRWRITFHLLSIPDPRSILKGVSKLLPGPLPEVTRRGVQDRRRYWDLAVNPIGPCALDWHPRNFGRRFDGAVRLPSGCRRAGRGVSQRRRRFGARLSPPRPALRRPNRDLQRYISRVGRVRREPLCGGGRSHCGANHHEFNLTPDLIDGLPRIAWHADEPFAISSAFALYFLAKFARGHVKVVLSGDGGEKSLPGILAHM